MEEFVKDLLSRFDFAYMLVVNLVTYLLIKAIDELNGERVIPTWVKRTTAVIVGVMVFWNAATAPGDDYADI